MTPHPRGFAPRRIALVRLSHLGDVVHALPVFHALRRFSAAEIAWVVQPEFAALLETPEGALPGPFRTIPFDRRGGWRAWPRLAAELARFGADWAVDAQGNVKSALVTLATGAPRRSGLHASDWRERPGAHVLTDRAEPAGPSAHAVERMLALARHVAPAADVAELAERDARPVLDLALSPAERERGRAELARLLPRASAPPIVLHLSRAGDVKSWPLEHAAGLAWSLAARGHGVVVVSGPGEIAEGRSVADLCAGVTGIAHLVGQRGPRALAALCAAVAERGGRFVGTDSGPLHVAAASGLDCVLLAGPQDERRTGPWPLARTNGVLGAEARGHVAVRTELELACAPCLARECTHRDGPVCLSTLDPEAVLSRLTTRPED